jgi:hypothetical protein
MKWTAEADQYIKDNIATLGLRGLADHFGVTYDAMKSHTCKMKLKAPRNRWTKEEDDLLKMHYEYAPKNFLVGLFPNHTWSGVVQHAKSYLGLKRISQDRYNVDYRFFSTWNEKTAYYLGFILADGHVCYNGDKYLQIGISQKDIDLLHKFKKDIKYEGPLLKGGKEKVASISGGYISHITAGVRINISNAKIVQDLMSKGIVPGNKTYVSTFPQNVPSHLVKHLIRGIIDGDGWVCATKSGYPSIGVCGTESVVTGVRDNLNIDCSNSQIRHKGTHYWDFMLYGKKAMIVLDWLYKDATVYLDRKYNKYLEAKLAYNKKHKNTTFSAVTETLQGHDLKTSNSSRALLPK